MKIETFETERFKCDQCEKYFTEDQMTTTGGDEIYCGDCYQDKVTEGFRVEHDHVYEYKSIHNAYIHVGRLNGRSLPQFISDLHNYGEIK